MLSIHAGNFRGILGTHPIKSISGDKLSWFGQEIEFSFNYYNLFLLKKQNQYAKNTHVLLHPINGRRGCKTTELKD